MASNSRKYRGWTSVEDSKLVETLLNMVNTGGFKCDNGFKSGYLTHLETCLKESLPTSNLSGRPHIESRIKTLKKDWQVVYDMLNTSGFGYDKTLNCVTTNAPGVWESYLENHKHAAKWRNKKLPHYEELCVIFGKDRAQGNHAKSVVEMEQEVNMEEQEQHMDDDFDEHSLNDGTNSSFQHEETSSVRGKKRKRTENALHSNFREAASLFATSLEKTATQLSQDITFELEIKKKTLMIPSELLKLTSLTQLERFKAIEKIKDDQGRVMTFWSLDEEEREAWVRFVLSL